MEKDRKLIEVIEDISILIAHVSALCIFTLIYPVICFIGFFSGFIVQTIKDCYNQAQN
jgi:hypothetical protein